MKDPVKKRIKVPQFTPKRHQRIVCLISEEENELINKYLHRYQISNKSRWMREIILAFVYKNIDEDYPSLFGEHDMRR